MLYVSDHGVVYEFRISAQNAVDFGLEASKTLKTSDGSEWLNARAPSTDRQPTHIPNCKLVMLPHTLPSSGLQTHAVSVDHLSMCSSVVLFPKCRLPHLSSFSHLQLGNLPLR